MSDYAGPYSGEERDPAEMMTPEARERAEGDEVSGSAKPAEEPDGPPQHRSEEELSDSGGTI
ncbi:MAG: hypothetical protein ACTHOD_18670 [Motilibacteraceae bacterium]